MKISEFQELMRTLYYHQDSERGIEKTFLWLVEEMGELARAVKREDRNLNEISEEMADVMAWVCSLANLFKIDIETSLINKYPGKCIKCNNNPCTCGKKDGKN